MRRPRPNFPRKHGVVVFDEKKSVSFIDASGLAELL
jgi:hypothetical protein